MSVTREVPSGDWLIRLDLAGQVLRLEVPEYLIGRSRQEVDGEPLLPTLPTTDVGPASAAALLLKAKQFDDGLHAAVEFAAHQGAGRFPGKASLLRSLAATLAAEATDPGKAAAVAVHAACQLGGLSVPVPDPLREAVRTATTDFLRDELLSKPLGFYTWSDPLRAIFRQDRLLQQPVDPGPADALARALEHTPGALASYDACLRLNDRLTNPPARPGLRGWAGPRSFFPASRSHEQILMEHLYGDRPVPDGFDLMTELIRRVRSGQIALEPGERSGWYDHQTWSLEPLVVPGRMPEADRLDLGERYRTHLEDLFRGALALARETHVKQLAMAFGGCQGPWPLPIWVAPGLTVEPLPSVYARRAAAYRFVRSVLEEAFGAEALSRMHRLTADGPSEADLAGELAGVERLFEGAAATARRELGMELQLGEEQTCRSFQEWGAGLAADRDVSRDVRMMVPVYYDVQREKTKVWAFLGWRTVPVDVSYATEPRVLAVEPAKPPEPTDRLSVLRRKFRKPPEKPAEAPPPVRFARDRYELAVPVMAEVYITRLLDRDEFRRHCDRFKTRDAILANLP
jgi:hypothetical protein